MLEEPMEIFQTLGTQAGIAVGLISVAAEILAAFFFLRTFKIIRRREYARLKVTEAEHHRCRAESDSLCTLDNWAIASRGLANKVQVDPEFDATASVRSRR